MALLRVSSAGTPICSFFNVAFFGRLYRFNCSLKWLMNLALLAESRLKCLCSVFALPMGPGFSKHVKVWLGRLVVWAMI